MRVVLLLLLNIALGACVSKAPQTEEWFAKAQDIAPVAQVPRVAFINQDVGHCGPATLAMVMNWAGNPITVDQIASQIYDPKGKGSLQADMISTARQQGMMAVTLQGLPQLLSEIESGHPVIVFENLALSWLPQWHYAVVLGYDLPKQEMILHSGPEAYKRWDMSTFERSWKLGDYWGLVVLPAGEIAKAAGEVSNLTAASSLEQLGHREAAEKSYQRILNQWPESLGALVGLGNIAYAKNDLEASISFLKRAIEAHPAATAAKHNLAVAENKISLRLRSPKKK